MNRSHAAGHLAAAFLAGAWNVSNVVRRGKLCLALGGRWLRPLARRVFAALPQKPDGEDLADFIYRDAGFVAAWERHAAGTDAQIRRIYTARPAMSPASGPPSAWTVPAIVTHNVLARWLGLSRQRLEWFADVQGRQALLPAGSLRHYSYQWLPKSRGRWRLLEGPKPRLMAFQRRILRDILNVIPAHDAAHGYRAGRSIVSYATPHCDQRIVLRFDLRDFFPSVRASRVHRVFRTAGFPREVSRLLTGLCTNAVPEDVWPTGEASWGDRRSYRFAHLPQGAPTSPALANLCSYRLDCRLHGLAESLGARYTRYADDLAFSGGKELERAARSFQVQVGVIALEEGFEIHTRKSRSCGGSVPATGRRRGQRQAQYPP